MKQSISRAIAWIVLTLFFTLVSITGNAQNKEPQIEQQGNVFIQKSTRGGQIIKTNYIYEDSKGQRDTIYLSSTGKAFVFKVSKNGNTYRKYLPQVTKKLNPQAYDEKTKSSKNNGR
jgi:hypothetical protein